MPRDQQCTKAELLLDHIGTETPADWPGYWVILVTKLLQVVDAKKASYGVENATYAVVQLAQTTMRSELGKITLDKTFEERATLNLNIVESIRYITFAHTS